ncbi:hypothetical protein ANOM_001329 [Aspergillus nomiae NRRL 13137]|uniref:Uncharacterized protein n=1 Tax=Aspergillus nomiae NRRL (strain ATCC 15546 / NRRL 13137 / CBS 260.88 / M93) TaxID=1509407 RepID=A0A0L1JFT9_ASPN3|nr:uncharacterized protein ANOM_001329 [Aspergillus nomiae NRRL 13137]KNG90611.1 hypothetical protein ANOM_001329 [Aspergillus nomiae NRRL 13137]
MGTGDSGLPDTDHPPQPDDSDESSSDEDITWFPGDGVCPTTAEFNHCCQLKLENWKNAAVAYQEGTESFQYYLTAFLDLLDNIPPFYHRLPGAVNTSGENDGRFNCDQPQKSIDYLQCLGCPAPVTYRTKAEAQLDAAIPICAKPLRSGYFTSIVLAWSYIISCRWVEILQQAGEESQIFHEQGMQIEDDFWDVITQGYWVARVKKHKGAFYSPWMLRREGTSIKRRDWKPVTSNSSLAFDILLGFCVLEGLEGEFLTGFASVLMLTSRHTPPPKFAPPMLISAAPRRSSLRPKDMVFLELYRSIDKFMSLSSTQDALDSLLCGVFFHPSVPCNLVGAVSLGVKKALSEVDRIDNRHLLSAVTNMKPYLSLLWAAAVCNDQVASFLNMALSGLPPICLVAAFWTNTAQSFLQIVYPAHDSEESITSRAHEFQTSFFCRLELSVPWSPAPPFGTTPVKNLSLEVRAHVAHTHRPISWRIYWILDSGEGFRPAQNETNEFPHPERYIADEQSGSATSRLFNWQRSYDDGIWLDDGRGDIEFIRRLQIHAWIIDPFDNGDDDPVEEPRHRELSVERILRWNTAMGRVLAGLVEI